jgi:hypothetical protein
MTAWMLSSVVALLVVNMPGRFVGWFGRIAGGLDLSLLAALFVPGIVYPALLYLYPEPRGVFGPDGPRGVPAANSEIALIVTRVACESMARP